MLNSLAIALQGVGYGSRVLALQGFFGVGVVEEPPPVAPVAHASGAGGDGNFRRRKRQLEDEEDMMRFIRVALQQLAADQARRW